MCVSAAKGTFLGGEDAACKAVNAKAAYEEDFRPHSLFSKP